MSDQEILDKFNQTVTAMKRLGEEHEYVAMFFAASLTTEALMVR